MKFAGEILKFAYIQSSPSPDILNVDKFIGSNYQV
jgi:hypothetical protein